MAARIPTALLPCADGTSAGHICFTLFAVFMFSIAFVFVSAVVFVFLISEYRLPFIVNTCIIHKRPCAVNRGLHTADQASDAGDVEIARKNSEMKMRRGTGKAPHFLVK